MYKSRITPQHGFFIGPANVGHYFDEKLATRLKDFFQGKTVIDLGCGEGNYIRHFRKNNIKCDGYDGNPHIFNPDCKIADLAEVVDLGLYDWVLSLEVGEHIPEEHEANFIQNLHKHNRFGIIVSWAIPGQTGFGHVNEKPNSYIKGKLSELGYKNNEVMEKDFRSNSTLPWFGNTIMVFERGC